MSEKKAQIIAFSHFTRYEHCFFAEHRDGHDNTFLTTKLFFSILDLVGGVEKGTLVHAFERYSSKIPHTNTAGVPGGLVGYPRAF